MKYIDLLNRFWEANRADRFTTSERELYYYLLNECNRSYWRMPVACPTSVVCAVIGINRATLMRAREGLRSRKFIRFEEGVQNSRAPTYTILDTSCDTGNATLLQLLPIPPAQPLIQYIRATQIPFHKKMYCFRLMNWSVGCWPTVSGTNR